MLAAPTRYPTQIVTSVAAYQRWVADKDTGALQKFVNEGQRRWLDTARTLLALYKDKGQDAGTAIENLLEPATEAAACCQPKTASSP